MPRLKPYSRSARCCSAVTSPSMPPICAQPPNRYAVLRRMMSKCSSSVMSTSPFFVSWYSSPSIIRSVTSHSSRTTSSVVLRERQRHRLDVEEVAEQDRDVVAPLRVDGQAAAPQLGVVDDVVVHERRGVDELDDRGVAARRGRRCSRTGAPPSAAPPGASRLPPLVWMYLPICGIRSTCDCTWRANSLLDPLEVRRGSARTAATRSAGEFGGRLGSKLVNLTIGRSGVSTRAPSAAADSCAAYGRQRNARSSTASMACTSDPRTDRPVLGARATTQRRLVPLAAVRHRRQKRAVGLDEQPIDAAPRGRVADVPPFGNVTMPAQRDVEAELERARGHRDVAREAVEHAAHARRCPPRRGSRSVSSSASRVWMTTGRSRSPGERAPARANTALLHVARREVVVVVEADLADRPGRGVGGERRCHERAPPALERPANSLGLVRMDADGEPHARASARRTRAGPRATSRLVCRPRGCTARASAPPPSRARVDRPPSRSATNSVVRRGDSASRSLGPGLGPAA